MNGEHLKIARDRKGIRQSDLGEMLGVTPNTIWRWEKSLSEPDDKRKAEIARLLDVTVAYLMEPSAELTVPTAKAVPDRLSQLLIDVYSRATAKDQDHIWYILKEYMTANEREYIGRKREGGGEESADKAI